MRNILLLLIGILLLSNSCNKQDLVDPTQNNIPDMDNLTLLQEATKEGVSLIFFHNAWCENCLEIRPTIEAIADDQQFENVYFAEVEFDKNKAIANYYIVRGFPTIVIVKDGVEKSRLEGKNHSRESIEERIKKQM